MFVSALIAPMMVAPAAFSLSSETLLPMKQPTFNGTHIVFSMAGDLWKVPKAGGQATRLTTGLGIETDPMFSPDGKTIAFTGQYDGNTDVYIVPASGGEPKRLTFNPEADQVRGWTPDGKSILFASPLRSLTGMPMLYTVSKDGGLPVQLPFPEGHQASFSADGTHIAYVPKVQFQAAWKRYRGGQTYPIWVGRLSDSVVYEIPRDNSNDFNPMWVGDKIYFLSDRDGRNELFVYETSNKSIRKLVSNSGFDFKSASAGPGGIVIERFGSIHLYDIASGRLNQVPIEINADFREVRPRYINPTANITSLSISPTGARVAVTARGDVFNVPAVRGETVNLTQSSGSHQRFASWSPDGKSLAYMSDERGDYELVIHSVESNEKRFIQLGEAPTFYYDPLWSPDGKKIAYTDKRSRLWLLDVESGTSKEIDRQYYVGGMFSPIAPSWSPDSKWLAYGNQQRNRLGAIRIYSVAEGKSVQITDGMSDASYPAFDKSGKYLYFIASTDSGRNAGFLDMTSIANVNTTSSVYAVVLRNDVPSPLLPEDDGEGAAAKPETPKTEPTDVRIDFDGIDQRTIALPIPARNYNALAAGSAGSIFLVESDAILSLTSFAGGATSLMKFDLASKQVQPFARGISGFDLTPDGSKILIAQGPNISVVPTAAPPQPGQGAVNLSRMQMRLEPREEWMQIFREAIRTQRDFFYAPNYHGVDLKALEAKYEPALDGIMSRSDLNYLLIDMLGELCVGHMYIGGGDIPGIQGVPSGLLGADYEIADGRYRFKTVYNGESWNPNLRAPLTQPGVNVKVGEYLIAVNGKNVTSADNIYELFEGTANRQTKIKVGWRADGTDAREVVVVPLASEAPLRSIAWVEGNRRKVEELSGGKVGYVHLPDTALGGFTSFNRYYFAQVGKEGMVIDERFNGGGLVADWIVDMMRRPLKSYWTGREGADFTSPAQSVYGPKAMIVNEYAGSGGDYLPWLFREHGIGPLIGKRTWGGLVGIGGTPSMIDGGMVTSPNFAFWNPNGTWDIENYGTAPDIEVEMDPALWRRGRDPQLERAVKEVLDAIAKNPMPKHTRPAWPDKRKPEVRKK